jgi:hypothetical protein
LKRNTALAGFTAILVFGALATPKADAEVTWNYAGNETTVCQFGPCTEPGLLTDSLNLSVTFNGPLTADINHSDLISDITAWSLTDTRGYINFSSTTSGSLENDNFSTDGDGNIIETLFFVNGPGWGTEGNAAAALVVYNEPANGLDEIGASDAAGAQSVAEPTSDGAWNLAQAPEPSTTLLASVGAAIVIIARRRKYRMANQAFRS